MRNPKGVEKPEFVVSREIALRRIEMITFEYQVAWKSRELVLYFHGKI